jgi:predicted regulator of Ras-like GTPase activity (Roadblock/LC7/MglB family)
VTPFRHILQRVVERVPGAMGAVFADWDGEAVDHFAHAHTAKDEMLILAAHYGVILNHVQSALHLYHFGEAEELIILHQNMDLVVRTVAKDYFMVLVVRTGAHLATALRETHAAASALRVEMI